VHPGREVDNPVGRLRRLSPSQKCSNIEETSKRFRGGSLVSLIREVETAFESTLCWFKFVRPSVILHPSLPDWDVRRSAAGSGTPLAVLGCRQTSTKPKMSPFQHLMCGESCDAATVGSGPNNSLNTYAAIRCFPGTVLCAMQCLVSSLREVVPCRGALHAELMRSSPR
jgi:hypothetical protein